MKYLFTKILNKIYLLLICVCIILLLNISLMYMNTTSIRSIVSADIQSLRPIISEGRMFFSGYCIDPPPVKFKKGKNNVIE